jgi:hypothetical protein
MQLTPARLDIILAASFNSHDDTLAAAATSVIASLVETADTDAASVLAILNRCQVC